MFALSLLSALPELPTTLQTHHQCVTSFSQMWSYRAKGFDDVSSKKIIIIILSPVSQALDTGLRLLPSRLDHLTTTLSPLTLQTSLVSDPTYVTDTLTPSPSLEERCLCLR